MRKIMIMFLLLSVAMFLVACSGSSVPAEKVCVEDSECVAAECCHSSDSVNEDYAPDCQGVLCSAECAANTLDCGQAKSRCVEGACTVVAVG